MSAFTHEAWSRWPALGCCWCTHRYSSTGACTGVSTLSWTDTRVADAKAYLPKSVYRPLARCKHPRPQIILPVGIWSWITMCRLLLRTVRTHFIKMLMACFSYKLIIFPYPTCTFSGLLMRRFRYNRRIHSLPGKKVISRPLRHYFVESWTYVTIRLW